ncbi:MAG: NAD-dependent epimerase/dehydratase family protein [Pirellulaceae bacterium]|nr:NAD-dependent epimerase/dehydratase family protein [Pirellulaceae bacterium]
MKVFVTGGTGLLGNTILRQLSQQSVSTTALVRNQVDDKVFAGIQGDFEIGDLSSLDVIERAVSQCDAVIHSAALIHLGWRRLDESMRTNRDGTKAIVDACLRHGRKLVYVGTVNTIAVGSRDQVADEETPWDHAGGQVPCSYVLSKRAALDTVLQGVQRGLRASVVHPGFMLGPWDWKPSSGRMLLELARNWTPIAPSGGCSVCDSRDVASGAIAAIDKGSDDGRQYVLGGHNWTYKKLWDEISVRMGCSKPVMRAGPIQRWIGATAGDFWAKVTGSEGDMNSAAVKISSQYHWYNSARAIKELGYAIRNPMESLDASAEWIREHHL